MAPSPPESDAAADPPARPTADPATARREAERSRAIAIATWLARQQKPIRDRDLSIGRTIGGIRRDVSSRRRKLGLLGEPWERLVPDALKARSRVDGIRGDTLHVTVDSPATSWQLDRLLRSGLTQSLSRACNDRIRRVKLRVGSIGETPGR